MGKKAKLNYIVDVIILLLFILSAFSGLGLMRPKEERLTAVSMMDEQRAIISDVHILSSFLMVAGVVVHLALHWRWMNVMSKDMMEQCKSNPETVNSASLST